MSNERDTQYRPARVSPPGSTVLDLLEEANITPEAFAAKHAYPLSALVKILCGEAPVGAREAALFATHLGGTCEFWLARERQYRGALAEKPVASDATREPEYEYVVQGHYGCHGWEELMAHETRAAASVACSNYDLNEPHVPHRVVKQRVVETEPATGTIVLDLVVGDLADGHAKLDYIINDGSLRDALSAWGLEVKQITVRDRHDRV
jgi:plasmid maintenance system antidote protein VapI